MGLIKLAIIGGAGYWAVQKYKQNQAGQGYCGNRRNAYNNSRCQQCESQEPLQFREPETARHVSLPEYQDEKAPRDFKSQQHLYQERELHNDSHQVVPYEMSPTYQPAQMEQTRYPTAPAGNQRPQYPDVVDNLIKRSKEFIEGLEKQRERERERKVPN